MTRLPTKTLAFSLGIALFGCWPLTQTVEATTGNDMWLGNTDGNWATGGNWTSSSANKPPIGGDSLIFGAAGTAGTTLINNITANTAFNAITFNLGADAFTFSGNAINLAGNITDNAINTETINFPMAMTAARTLVVTNEGNLVIGGVISGGYNLTANLAAVPAGTTISPANTSIVTLNGSAPNTYTGGTMLSGTLLLDFANMASPTDLINGNSSLTFGGMASTLSVRGKSSGSTAQTFAGVSFYKNYGASVVLNPNGGGSTILTFGNTWSRGSGYPGNSFNIDLSAGGTLVSTPSIAVNNVLGFATVKDASSVGLATISGGNIIRLTGQTTLPTSSSSATVNYITSGDVTMSAANFSVNSLTLDASSGSGSLDLAGKTMAITSLGLLQVGRGDYTISNGQVGATSSEVIIHQMGTGTLTINGMVGSGSASAWTKNGPGTLVLGSANTDGAFTINQGTVKLGAENALGANPSFYVNNGGILDLDGHSASVGTVANNSANAGMVTNSGSLASLSVGNGNAMGLGSVLFCGPVNLIVSGGGQLGLSPNNTHTGGTTFTNNVGGNVANFRINAPSALGTGALGFNGNGMIQQTATGITVTNAVTVNNNGNMWWIDKGVYSSTGPWGGTGKINVLNDVNVNAMPIFNFAGDMSGFQGTLLLSANTNASAQGTVCTYSLGGNSTFDGSQAVWDLFSISGTVSSSPILQWAGNGSQTIKFGDLNSSGTTGNGTIIVSNSVAGTTATFEVGNLNQNSSFSGALVTGTGDIALTKVGAGTWMLSGANTYTGNTTISAGTLAISGGGSLASANFGIATNAAFDVSALSSYTLNSGTLTVGIDKTSGARTQGQVVIADKNLTCAGSLTVSKTGTDTLASGDSFTLVSKTTGTLSGWFSSVSLPALPGGLTWDTNDLATGGMLDVYGFTTNAIQTMATTKNTPASMAMSKLTGKTTGARGPVTVLSVSSASGATVAVNSGTGNIDYTPAPDLTGPDTFTAVLSDGHGSITATVNVTVNAVNAGPEITPTQTDNQSASFTASGLPGTNYVVQISTNLPTFLDYMTNPAAPNGLIIFTDSVPISSYANGVYFRLRQQ